MYSIVIATCNRIDFLVQTINCIFHQEYLPTSVIVIDSSDDDFSNQKELKTYIEEGKLVYQKVNYKSSAIQRNEGASLVSTKYIVFLDDDVSFAEDFFKKIFNAVLQNSFKIVAPRQEGAFSRPPSDLLKFYYRVQSGYNDKTYGGKLFGCGLNCYPCYEIQKDSFISSDWLSSTCLIMEKEIFDEVKFPNFEGYSFGEDVYLTGTLKKKYDLYWLSEISYIHYSPTSAFKNNKKQLRNMAFKNQKRIALDVIGLNPINLFLKQLLHKIFLFCIDLK